MLIKIETQNAELISGIIIESGEKLHFAVSSKDFHYQLTIASNTSMSNVIYRGRVNAFTLEEIEKAINWFSKMNNKLAKPVGNVFIVKWADRTRYFSDVNDANAFKCILTTVNGLEGTEVQIETVNLY